MLSLQKVTKSYQGPNGTISVLRSLSLDMNAGDFVALQGPSGVGKSTLLLIAGGMLRPDEGIVRIAGADLYRLNAKERAFYRVRHVGFVFQQFHLVPYLTVLENVLASSVPLPSTDAVGRAEALLEQFGLRDRRRHLPGQLSSGERQRAALARALLHKPGLVLADEPTGNLDYENGKIVLDALAEYAQQGGSVLLVTHDPRAAAYAQRVVPLSKVEAATS